MSYKVLRQMLSKKCSDTCKMFVIVFWHTHEVSKTVWLLE